MMVVTHIIVSFLLGIPFIMLFPSLATEIFIASLMGGLTPDLDLLIGEHRKTFHFPVYSSKLTILSLPLVIISPWFSLLSAFLLGMSSHSVSDIFGGGLEKRPWEQTSTKAVYSHFHRKWIPPKHIVKYDGSIGDFMLLALITGIIHPYYPVKILLVLLSVGFAYVLIRKTLPRLEDFLCREFELLRPLIEQFH